MFLRALTLLPLALNVVAQQFAFEDDDLLSFVTLPGVRALKFDVQYQDRNRVSPGYWFVAPYGQMDPEGVTRQYRPYQVGPYIYDADGVLVWAGSPMFDNRNIFDFRAVHSIGNQPHLSLVWQHGSEDNGHGVILDNSYEIKKKIPMPSEFGAFDIHEFNILDDGETALALNYRTHDIPLDTFGRPGEWTRVLAAGFAQIDLKSEKLVYTWDGVDKIALQESNFVDPSSPSAGPPGWDYVHINSVDKNKDGDYLISLRFTDTIYLISGQDGSIKWRLGGKTSSFTQDFTFSKQHDAKFIETNGTRYVISFLNNASDELRNEEDISSALFVELETGVTPMTAKVIRRYPRPDGGLTRLRGNTQLLPNNNVFVGWSERGYISEFSPEGDVLLSANFVSSRFSTYRAYKFEFTGRPNNPPALVASVWGTDKTDLTTSFYVSWNGATDVAGWNFYARAAKNGHPIFVGSTNKTDFETLFIAKGYLDWVTVEAIDREGRVLGTSPLQRSKVPAHWGAAGFTGDLANLKADDPQKPRPTPQEEKQEEKHEDKQDEKQAPANELASNDKAPASRPSTPAMPFREDPDLKEITRLVHETYALVRNISGIFVLIVLGGLVCGIGAGIYFLLRRKPRAYEHVPREIPDEEIRLHSVRE
ncbi:ASST-domain-containing protein [Aspergillus avenaceus]|uniref:ASST-domain-containing protein n=1 Tax=Aspergillus avenaceus TaxID=36643 RepID=A0A5N6U0G2_ASPAV|nr:ASST-domain-containing protein [Aspergillus avenaceus]